MNKYCCLIVCVMMMTLFASTGFSADEMKSGGEWKDITDKVFANPADKGGWSKDENGQVFAHNDGNSLKIVTSDFGILVVDLVNKSVVSLEKDGTSKAVEVTKMIQREFGLTLVIKAKSFKVRVKMKDKVEGMKHIEGIKAM